MNSVLINDGLFCTKNIKTAADVKGKTVAVSTFGGTSHGSVLLSLKSLGLTSADVTITEIGGQSSRIAALVGGSIGCAPVDVALAADMKAQGLNQLTDLVKSGLAWGRSGLAASDDYLAKNPNTALVVVASALEAQNMFWTDPATVAQNFADYAQIKLDVATAAVKSFPNTGDRTMMWTTDAFTMPQQTLAAVQPDIAGVDLSIVADPSFLKKLADIGFYAKIGDPLP
jgi:ABC-type nitrate/sulfonate/bicarbonate transport systems, periplasmic components